MPKDLPPVSVLPTGDEINAAARRISAPVDGLSVEERKQVINGGCEAVDYAEAINGTSEDAVEYLFTHSDSAGSYRLQAKELVDKLMKAESDIGRAGIFGRAALCEWAGGES